MPHDTMRSGYPIAVFGLGQTGWSILRYAYARGVREAYVYDQHAVDFQGELPQDFLIHQTNNASFSEWPWQTISAVCLSPGISPNIPEVKAFRAAGGDVLGDVECFARAMSQYPKENIIAVTGSNGKSTVVSWLAHAAQKLGLRVALAGNIGRPVLDCYLEYRNQPRPDLWVLELSSFQLETTEHLHCMSASVLNCSEDHLDRYHNFLDYVHTKSKIFTHAKTQVFQIDDPWVRSMKPIRLEPDVCVLSCAYQEGLGADYFIKNDHLYYKDNPLIHVDQLPLRGMHHAINALHVLALLSPLHKDHQAILTAMSDFPGLPHRVQFVEEIDGVSFIDDSKGTNVGATEAALKGMKSPVVLIAGGQGKGQDFTPLARAIKNSDVRSVFLIGEDAPLIARSLLCCDVPVYVVSDLVEAVQKSFQCAQSGDAVLLSPACASFDMFRGYAHRSQVFLEAVLGLKQ